MEPNLTIARMTLDPDPAEQKIQFPKNGKLLDIGVYDGAITLWVLCTQEVKEWEERIFHVLQWGKPLVPEEQKGRRFLVTCVLGVMARHVFEVKPPKKQTHEVLSDDDKK